MTDTPAHITCDIAVIGGGPAGLFAAECLSGQGFTVHLFERKGSVGRKFLIAGRGGLNLTHSDPPDLFATRYRERAGQVGDWLRDFDAAALREWAKGLGIDTFIGSSGRVFPTDMKAAPLLRAWVKRLRDRGVVFHVKHDWQGWDATGDLRFQTEQGVVHCTAKACLLALGGASWPQLGSDGSWQSVLRERGMPVHALRPANCGFEVTWSDIFRAKFAGHPLKPIALLWRDTAGVSHRLQGECVISDYGIEGSAVYAASSDLRDALAHDGQAELGIDLMPGQSEEKLRALLEKPRQGRSTTEFLRRQLRLDGVKLGLIYERMPRDAMNDASRLAAGLKSLPIRLLQPRPIAEAISSAGGVAMEGLDNRLMSEAMPGLFCAGEMLDWEAPTGGYLLTACFASAKRAADGVLGFLQAR